MFREELGLRMLCWQHLHKACWPQAAPALEAEPPLDSPVSCQPAALPAVRLLCPSEQTCKLFCERRPRGAAQWHVHLCADSSSC